MSEAKPVHLWVSGIVAQRNHVPYVQIATDERMVAQLTIAEARSVAFDILSAAHNAEADAVIVKFFSEHELPMEACAALMQDFRDFRHKLETEAVETTYSDPEAGGSASHSEGGA